MQRKSGWAIGFTMFAAVILLMAGAAQIIAGCKPACQNISPQAFVDIIAQKHRNSFVCAHYLAVVKYHVKR